MSFEKTRSHRLKQLKQRIEPTKKKPFLKYNSDVNKRVQWTESAKWHSSASLLKREQKDHNLGRKRNQSTADIADVKYSPSDMLRLFLRKKQEGTNRIASGSMSVPTSKFSLRWYGSHKALENERSRQKSYGVFIIHPYSNFRFYWDLISLAFLIVTMIVIPVGITFFNEDMTTIPGWMLFNLSLDRATSIQI
ncbi:Oidioi.mRNA.OKI2018_I69.XSR.g16632.t1.cds [Oikopleura dioica]|uniref:Oidioi.mRNA.OKI2018_I69.XSR.g16632.t1.cds n=1 Tax=Oikopleura dioica TaxID=34765 RepID=A0ABN7SGR0_OIKDI|nr:Oidioi.mRNA.OKI2018_I69.XSR.g16632.t1.cds [Oikopleura dioica]